MTWEPPLYVQTLQYSARQDRQWIDLIFTEGVADVAAGELAVTQRATGANLSVDVAPGTVIITGDSVARQGKYLARLVEGENVVIPAPPAADSRIDLVVARVLDSTADGGPAASDGAVLQVVPGTPAAIPVAPAVPATAVVLAQVVVAAGVSSIVTANITDKRTQLNATTLKVGTQFASMTTTQRDALTGADLFEGRTIYNSTTSRLESYRSAAWTPTFPTRQETRITTTGTWTPPAGVTQVEAVVCGGGGGGGVGTANFGGGSGYVVKGQVAVTPGSPVAVVVGAGGAAGAAGSPSSFGSVTAKGGNAAGNGGSGGGVNGQSGGVFGGHGTLATSGSQVQGLGSSPFPETPGGGGGASSTLGGGAGTATAGGAGAGSATAAGVSAAAGTGAGGGAASSGTAGSGGSGFVTVRWWSA